MAFVQTGSLGEVDPWEGALKSVNWTSDLSWAILGKLLGLSESQIFYLQNEVDEDTIKAHLQFVERI